MPLKKKSKYGIKDSKTGKEYVVEFEREKLTDKVRNTIKIGDMELKMDELRTLFFLESDRKNREKLMEWTEEQMINFNYYVERKLEKDYKQGEVVAFFMDFPVEVFRLEAICKALVKINGLEASKEIINKIIKDYEEKR